MRSIACFAAAVVVAALGATPTATAGWREELRQPPREMTQVPFWFWNDELSDRETARKMADFRDKGVYGFVIHARMGLPAEIAYMGPRWLARVKFAVEEAARTGMRVCLYDEGMYPSGSAHGEVVRSNPAFAAQGLAAQSKEVSGPAEVDAAAAPEGRHVAIVAVPIGADGRTLELDRAIVVDPRSGKASLGTGRWRVMRFTAVPSGGRIRGVHPGEEGGQPGAPPAADLLSSEAMRAFLRFSYEPYYRTLKEHFGKSVFAVFTDEPSMLGRGHRRGLQPWTEGLAEDFARRRGYSLVPNLPALFEEAGPRMAHVCADFSQTLAERLEETYYRQLAEWCRQHKVDLTGHPAGSDEIRPLRNFGIPSQDMVWRWLVPDSPTALEGANSTVAKCSSSVARHDARRRNGNEIYGAYGWRLTIDEMKWLADWLHVRGVNLLYPHAFYYSVRESRGMERPPDVGPHNAWWPHYRLLADYTSRLSWLMTDSQQVCQVAVLSVGNRLPWRAPKWLFQNQVDFNYLEDWRLLEQARPGRSTVRVGPMEYRLLVVDEDEPLPPALAAKVRELAAAGLLVRKCSKAASADLVAGMDRDVAIQPACSDLRAAHVVKQGVSFYLLVNEGEQQISARLSVPVVGRAEWFDPWLNTFRPAFAKQEKEKLVVPLRLARRESLVLCVNPASLLQAGPAEPAAAEQVVPIPGPWRIVDRQGKPRGERLGPWEKLPGLERFVGSLRYQARLPVSREPGRRYTIELPAVGDWAVLKVNGRDLGPRFWTPMTWDITNALRPGENEASIEVTGSLANRFEPKTARPSGLLEAPRLRIAADPRPAIVCLGDSITFGANLSPSEAYPARLEEILPEYRVINAGIGGNTSQAGLARLARDVLVHKPKIVVVLFGTNDSTITAPGKYRVPVEDYAENLRRIVTECRAAGARVVMATLPAIMPEPYFTRHPKDCYAAEGGLEKILLRYRAAAQSVAASLGVPVVDLYPIFDADKSLLRGPPDGVHPTARGSQVIAETVAEKIKA